MIVDAALHHRIELDRREPGALRGGNAVEHVLHAAEAARHLREYGRIETVEAHRDALQAGGAQFGGVLRKQHAVGRQRDVLDPGQAGQIADQIGEPGAQQRLASGDPQLHHTELQEQPRQPQQLWELEALAGFQKTILVVKALARHAVRATKVAAVDDRQAQIAQWAAQAVLHQVPARQYRLDVGGGHLQGYQIEGTAQSWDPTGAVSPGPAGSPTSETGVSRSLWRNRRGPAAAPQSRRSAPARQNRRTRWSGTGWPRAAPSHRSIPAPA